MKYEIMLILSSKQTDKEIEKNLKEIKGLIAENGFELVDEDLWGVREMAYSIKGNSKGYYVVYNFTGEPEGMQELAKDLHLHGGILRHLMSKVADDYMLLRYDPLANTGKAGKLSSPAEELSKKVREKKSTKKAEEAPENTEKLDETLQAIIEDKDL